MEPMEAPEILRPYYLSNTCSVNNDEIVYKTDLNLVWGALPKKLLFLDPLVL